MDVVIIHLHGSQLLVGGGESYTSLPSPGAFLSAAFDQIVNNDSYTLVPSTVLLYFPSHNDFFTQDGFQYNFLLKNLCLQDN